MVALTSSDVRLLVQHGSEHARLHPRRRVELDRDGRPRAAADHGALVAVSRRQAGRHPGVPLVPAPAPDEQPHQGPGEHREEHSQPRGEPRERAGHPRAHGTAGATGRVPLPHVGREVTEGVPRVGGDDAGALAGGKVRNLERRGLPGRGGALVGGAELAVVARSTGGGHRARHRRRDVLLGKVVRGVDHVVVELRSAVADVVDDVLEAVGHDVVRGAAHREGRAADADLAVGTEVRDRDVGRRPRRGRHRDLAQLEVAVGVLLVLVAGPDLDVAQDAVPLLPFGEAPGDRLRHDDGAVGLDLEVHLQAVGLLHGGQGDEPGDSPPARRCAQRRPAPPSQPAPAARGTRRGRTTAPPTGSLTCRRRSLSPRHGGGPRSRGLPPGHPGAHAGRSACRRTSCPWPRRSRPWPGRP